MKQQQPEIPGSTPVVSVLMLAYNVGPFVGAAIEGVLQQKTDFPLELVIGEDCAPDNTRAVCAQYQQRFPEIIRLLPAEQNLGIAGNAARTLAQCRGKYIAICDGDDIWQNPYKLQQQVAFLEQNPAYGLSYSDVATIDENGRPLSDPEHEALRPYYAQGEVFVRLLDGNFINNSTAVVRRELLNGHRIDTDRNYYIHDYLMWLHVAMRCKVHFLPTATTAYRKHSGGVTNSAEKARRNTLKLQTALPDILLDFARQNRHPLNREEKIFLFRKTLSPLIRKTVPWRKKIQTLPLTLRFFPGFGGLLSIASRKLGARFHAFFHKKRISNLKESNI